MRAFVRAMLLVVSAAWCGACASAPPAAGTVRGEVQARPAARVDILPGRGVVAPLIGRAWARDDWFRPGVVLEARFDDGTVGAARVVRAMIDPPALEEPSARAAARWLDWPGVWSVARGPSPDPGVGVWLLTIDAPPVDSRRVTVGGVTLALEPIVIEDRAASVWSPPFAVEPSAEPLASAVGLERRSPLTRWRSRWLTRGLLAVTAADAPPDRFDDPLLEALAELTEARVAGAMSRLGALDAALAARAARALTLVVAFADGLRAPAWTIADRDIDLLLNDLLDRGASDERVLAGARAWLGTQPDGFSWVVDDAGITDGLSGTTLSSVGVANLADTPRPAWVTSPARESPDMTLCPPFSATIVSAAAWSPEQRAPSSAAVTVSLGQWRTQAVLRPAPIGVGPPGLVAGPLLHDWMLPAMRRADDRSLTPGPEWATAALLHRVPVDAGEEELPSSGVERAEAAWVLFVECRRPATAAAGTDRVTVWLGLTAAPVATITVSSDGLIDAAGPHAEVHASVAALPDRWTATVRLPARAVDADGVLRLGLSRVDSRGLRSAWPRPMLPWSAHPGRLAIDTRAWDQ